MTEGSARLFPGHGESATASECRETEVRTISRWARLRTSGSKAALESWSCRCLSIPKFAHRSLRMLCESGNRELARVGASLVGLGEPRIQQPAADDQAVQRCPQPLEILRIEPRRGRRGRLRRRSQPHGGGGLVLRCGGVVPTAGLVLGAHDGPQPKHPALALAPFLAAAADGRLRRALLPDRLDEPVPLLAQNPLHAADRIALAVQQMADATQEIDVVGTIIAAAAAALHRTDLGKAGFPEPQHVLRHVEVVGDLADGAECFRRLFQRATLASCGCGLLSATALRPVIDTLLQDGGGLEDHHATRRDRHRGAGLGIASDALPLLADHEGAEGRELHGLAALEAIRDLLEHEFHECGGFGARQADLLVHRLAQIRAGDCLSGHRPAPITAAFFLEFQRYELDYAWSTGG